MYDTELYHHGVLGMKWGVHRKRDNNKNSTSNKQRAIYKEYKQEYKRTKKNMSERERTELYEKYNKKFNATYNKKYDVTTRMIDSMRYGDTLVNSINDHMNAGKDYGTAVNDVVREYNKKQMRKMRRAVAFMALPAIANVAIDHINR